MHINNVTIVKFTELLNCDIDACGTTLIAL